MRADIQHIAESILREIETRGNRRLLIAIDGRCAAGKTTLAAYLQELLSCNVIHMDHFFLRPEQRSAKRLNEPGGNVDYERFLEEVLIPLKNGGDFSYRPYDCRSQGFGETISICEPPLTSLQIDSVNIIEGSYSCHPELRDYYDLRIFLSVDPEEQMCRIRQRNGNVRAVDFRDKWIPLEERYFISCHVRKYCDLLYESVHQ